MHILVLLKFVPLEFETLLDIYTLRARNLLKFTPLEFETIIPLKKGQKNNPS